MFIDLSQCSGARIPVLFKDPSSRTKNQGDMKQIKKRKLNSIAYV